MKISSETGPKPTNLVRHPIDGVRLTKLMLQLRNVGMQGF